MIVVKIPAILKGLRKFRVKYLRNKKDKTHTPIGNTQPL
jgi:hypothetical protein